VRIIDGTLRYADALSGAREEVKGLTLDIAMPTLAAPLSARGSLTWRGEAVAIDGRLSTLAALAADRPAALKVTLEGKPLNLSYDGALRIPGDVELDGALAAKTGSVRALAAWAGAPLGAGSGLGPASVDGLLKVAGKTTTLNDANLGLDGATATGSISLDTGRARPFVQANLQVSEIILDRYLGTAGDGQRAAPTPSPTASPATSAPAAAGPRSIDDLLRGTTAEPSSKRGPQVRGFSQSAGWSEDLIDLTALGAVDVDARIAAGRFVHRDLHLGATRGHLGLANRVLKVTIDDMQLYEGRGRGVVTLDASAQAATIGANLSVDGISALPLLKASSGFDWLAGRGRLALALAGRGQTERQIVETLNGRIDLALTDGAVIGYDVGAILAGLQQGRLRGTERNIAEKTEFKELAGAFIVANGIAQNNDLRLTSPHLRMTGIGKIDLPRRTLDYTTRPKLAVAAQVPGVMSIDVSKLDIPVRIAGPWEKPQVSADVGGVLNNPDQAAKVVNEIGRQLKSGNVEEAVKGFLGGDSKAGARARDFLNQFRKQ
jgi:AsmA protein